MDEYTVKKYSVIVAVVLVGVLIVLFLFSKKSSTASSSSTTGTSSDTPQVAYVQSGLPNVNVTTGATTSGGSTGTTGLTGAISDTVRSQGGLQVSGPSQAGINLFDTSHVGVPYYDNAGNPIGSLPWNQSVSYNPAQDILDPSIVQNFGYAGQSDLFHEVYTSTGSPLGLVNSVDLAH